MLKDSLKIVNFNFQDKKNLNWFLISYLLKVIIIELFKSTLGKNGFKTEILIWYKCFKPGHDILKMILDAP